MWGRRRREEPEEWKTLARAFLRMKVERDHALRERDQARIELERASLVLEACRSRIRSLAEENGEGGW